MQGIVEDYKILCQNMGVLIQKSGYKNAYLAEKIGMPAPSFSAKKKRGNWTVQEVEKLLALIENEELEEYLMVELMRTELASPEPNLTFDEFKSRMGW